MVCVRFRISGDRYVPVLGSQGTACAAQHLCRRCILDIAHKDAGGYRDCRTAVLVGLLIGLSRDNLVQGGQNGFRLQGHIPAVSCRIRNSPQRNPRVHRKMGRVAVIHDGYAGSCRHIVFRGI